MPSRYSLAIRAAHAADADGIVALLRAAGVKAEARTLAARLEQIAAQSGLALLAEEWGPPSGVLALNWRWTLTDDLKIADVTTLVVDPDQRRKGIARLLLKAAARAARAAGCDQIRILVAETTQDVVSFCTETGFERTGIAFTRPLRKRGQAID